MQQHADASRLLGRVKWQALARTARPTPVIARLKHRVWRHTSQPNLVHVQNSILGPIFHLQAAIDYFTVNETRSTATKGYPTPEPDNASNSLFVIHDFVTSMILLSATQFSAGFDLQEDAVSAPDESEYRRVFQNVQRNRYSSVATRLIAPIVVATCTTNSVVIVACSRVCIK